MFLRKFFWFGLSRKLWFGVCFLAQKTKLPGFVAIRKSLWREKLNQQGLIY